VFHDNGDGIWAVKEDAAFFGATTVFPGGERARVPEQLIDVVLDAAEECPGACIFVEP
jgi:ferredoxin